MDQELLNFLVSVGISAVVAILVHTSYKEYWPACLLAAVASSLCVHVRMYFQLGYNHSLIGISAIVMTVIAFPIAMVCGFLILILRKRTD